MGGTMSPDAAVQPDAGLVGGPGFALQADHWLVMQQEAIVSSASRRRATHAWMRSSSARSTALGSKISERLPPTPDRRLHAVVGLGQHLGDAGDLLADLHAADAGGIACASACRPRTHAEANACSACARPARRWRRGRRATSTARLCVRRSAPPRDRRPGRIEHAAQAFGDRRAAGRRPSPGRSPAAAARSGPAPSSSRPWCALVLRGTGDGVFQRLQERRAVEQPGDLVALAQFLDFAREFGVGSPGGGTRSAGTVRLRRSAGVNSMTAGKRCLRWSRASSS